MSKRRTMEGYVKVTKTNWVNLIAENLLFAGMFASLLCMAIWLSIGNYPNFTKIYGLLGIYGVFALTTRFWHFCKELGESIDSYTETKKIKVKLEEVV